MKLYLAGPLFTLAERQFNRTLAAALEELGHECFLPQRDAPQGGAAEAIFRADVGGIGTADVVVACLDGPDPDSGTAWECGYAYARGKPIVVYRTDFRGAEDAPGEMANLMLTRRARTKVDLRKFNALSEPDLVMKELAFAIHEAVREAYPWEE